MFGQNLSHLLFEGDAHFFWNVDALVVVNLFANLLLLRHLDLLLNGLTNILRGGYAFFHIFGGAFAFHDVAADFFLLHLTDILSDILADLLFKRHLDVPHHVLTGFNRNCFAVLDVLGDADLLINSLTNLVRLRNTFLISDCLAFSFRHIFADLLWHLLAFLLLHFHTLLLGDGVAHLFGHLGTFFSGHLLTQKMVKKR